MYFPFLYTAVSATTYLLGSNFYKYCKKYNADVLVGELSALLQAVRPKRVNEVGFWILKYEMPQVFEDKYGFKISNLVYNAIINYNHDDLQLNIDAVPIYIPFNRYFKGAIFGVGVYESFLNGYPQYAYDRVKYSFMNPEDKNKDLHEAIKDGQSNIVKFLIDAGADIEAKDNYGDTAFMRAAGYGRLDIVRFLIDEGADIEAKNNSGDTALTAVASSFRVDIVKLLLDAGADIEAKDNLGGTALIRAVMGYGSVNIVELLIDAGADIEVKDNFGKTALIWAMTFGNSDIIDLLINAEDPSREMLVSGLTKEIIDVSESYHDGELILGGNEMFLTPEAL